MCDSSLVERVTYYHILYLSIEYTLSICGWGAFMLFNSLLFLLFSPLFPLFVLILLHQHELKTIGSSWFVPVELSLLNPYKGIVTCHFLDLGLTVGISTNELI